MMPLRADVRHCRPRLVSALVSTLFQQAASGFRGVQLCADLPVMAEWVGETPYAPSVLLGDGRDLRCPCCKRLAKHRVGVVYGQDQPNRPAALPCFRTAVRIFLDPEIDGTDCKARDRYPAVVFGESILYFCAERRPIDRDRPLSIADFDPGGDTGRSHGVICHHGARLLTLIHTCLWVARSSEQRGTGPHSGRRRSLVGILYLWAPP